MGKHGGGSVVRSFDNNRNLLMSKIVAVFPGDADGGAFFLHVFLLCLVCAIVFNGDRLDLWAFDFSVEYLLAPPISPLPFVNFKCA